MKSAVVLLSSGLDSTVNLYQAYKDLKISLALTMDYGQRAADKEIQAAQKISSSLDIRHQVVHLDWLKHMTRTALVNRDEKIPTAHEVSIDSHTQSLQTAKLVWVPNRNGVFLNIAASFAEDLNADYVIVGFNKEEAQTFPDNSAEFISATEQSLSFSTLTQVRVKCYTVGMDKTQIVQFGKELRIPFADIWPCYFSGDQICGQCESCLRYQRAVQAAGGV